MPTDFRTRPAFTRSVATTRTLAEPQSPNGTIRTAAVNSRSTAQEVPIRQRVRGDSGLTPPRDPVFEAHFSVQELAKLWRLSVDAVRRLFLNEPGVVIFCHNRPGRRVYRTLRVPASIALRVYRRMRKAE